MNDFTAGAVYVLCLATSALCAFLLVRTFLTTRALLLAWVAAAFVLLAVNNLLLVLSFALGPHVDLIPFRFGSAFAAVTVLIFGFIRET